MADVFDPGKRSHIMARVKNKNTRPEKIVRNVLISLGVRYRLKYDKLPCKPDIIFPGRKKVIFVHGCFWHGHQGCKRAKLPKKNYDFWTAKILKNMNRDEDNINNMVLIGWECLVVWQCQLKEKDRNKLINNLKTFLQIT